MIDIGILLLAALLLSIAAAQDGFLVVAKSYIVAFWRYCTQFSVTHCLGCIGLTVMIIWYGWLLFA